MVGEMKHAPALGIGTERARTLPVISIEDRKNDPEMRIHAFTMKGCVVNLLQWGRPARCAPPGSAIPLRRASTGKCRAPSDDRPANAR